MQSFLGFHLLADRFSSWLFFNDFPLVVLVDLDLSLTAYLVVRVCLQARSPYLDFVFNWSDRGLLLVQVYETLFRVSTFFWVARIAAVLRYN